MSPNHSLVNYATVRIIPVQASNSQHNDNRQTHWRLTPLRLCLSLLLLMLALVACGPKNSESGSDLSTQVIHIAQDFQKSGDVGSARAQLEKLDVANPTQYLIFLAEDRASSAPGTPETTALVQFALALGLQSGELMQYAVQNGLLPTRVPTAAAVAQVPVQVDSSASNAQATPAVPVAVVVTGSASSAAPPVASNVVSATGSIDSSSLTPAAGAQAITQTTTVSSSTGAAATVQPQAGANALPTATPQPPTATPVTKPQVQASNGLNVRGGPGTDYPVVGALNDGEAADIVAKSPAGDWWEVNLTTGGTGWVYSALVKTAGDTGTIAVASDIPPAPPTATPAPIAEVPTAAPAPAEQPTAAAPPPASSGNDFVLIEKRLWGVVENGGVLDSGGSVKCGLKRELHVIVLDANGSPINGVAVQALYGAQEIYVTGSQGKGDGQSEFVLGSGQGVKVIRDTDGHDVTSDVADGLSTHSPDIPHSDLIAAGYCRDDASCDKFNKSLGCWGHHSWTVTFKRRY